MTDTKTTTEKELAGTVPAPKPPIVSIVQKKIDGYVSSGRLTFPENYNQANALVSANLALLLVENLDKKKILDQNGRPTGVVTEASIVNALFDMCVQGLNPAKKQCYFIVYGNTLTLQRSYFGEQALAERVKPGIEVYSAIVWAGDEFDYGIIRGRTVVFKHKPNPDAHGKTIQFAYSGVYDAKTNEDFGIELMSLEQIKKSWSMSKTYKSEGGSTPHHKFPDQMALRTVIRRRCKPIINASTDELLKASVLRQEIDAIEGDVLVEIAENANHMALTAPEQVPDNVNETTGEVTESGEEF